jgi:cyclophilin family peptidyl-prolyl cis-trans isomerase
MKKKICFAMMACIALAVWAAEPAVAPAAEPAVAEASKAPNPVVRITTSVGNMLVELFEDECPNTVANFIELASKGFYIDMSFHRVIPGFMAQGGCPYSKFENQGGQPGTGGPGYRFEDEFNPKLKHTGRGILSMANSGPNTNGSQFFICFVPTPHLDGKHTVFGKLIKGLDVLNKIEGVGTPNGTPEEEIRFNIEVVSKRNHPYEVKKLK